MLLTGPRSFDPAPFDDISFDLCTRRNDVVIMSADLSKYCQVVRVKNELPRQHLDVGMPAWERVKHPDEVAQMALHLASQPIGGPTGQIYSLARRPM